MAWSPAIERRQVGRKRSALLVVRVAAARRHLAREREGLARRERDRRGAGVDVPDVCHTVTPSSATVIAGTDDSSPVTGVRPRVRHASRSRSGGAGRHRTVGDATVAASGAASGIRRLDDRGAAGVQGLGRGQPESGRIVGRLAARDLGRGLRGSPTRTRRGRRRWWRRRRRRWSPNDESADHEHRRHGTGAASRPPCGAPCGGNGSRRARRRRRPDAGSRHPRPA